MKAASLFTCVLVLTLQKPCLVLCNPALVTVCDALVLGRPTGAYSSIRSLRLRFVGEAKAQFKTLCLIAPKKECFPKDSTETGRAIKELASFNLDMGGPYRQDYLNLATQMHCESGVCAGGLCTDTAHDPNKTYDFGRFLEGAACKAMNLTRAVGTYTVRPTTIKFPGLESKLVVDLCVVRDRNPCYPSDEEWAEWDLHRAYLKENGVDIKKKNRILSPFIINVTKPSLCLSGVCHEETDTCTDGPPALLNRTFNWCSSKGICSQGSVGTRWPWAHLLVFTLLGSLTH